MGTVADKLNLLLSTKAAIRQAITGKGQSVADTDPFSSYPAKIAAIQSGVDTSDATATASDILSGKTAYVKGSKVTGAIASKGAADLTASGAAVSVPAGYYPSAVSKSVAAATQATPGITVSSGGLITASATQVAGYVAAGTKSATKQLTTQAAKTVTPTTSQQTAVASGRYTTGAVTVAGDANLVAGNIKSGVSIFGVAGSLEGKETATITFDANETKANANIFWINEDHLVVSESVRFGYSATAVLPVGSIFFVNLSQISFLIDSELADWALNLTQIADIDNPESPYKGWQITANITQLGTPSSAIEYTPYLVAAGGTHTVKIYA